MLEWNGRLYTEIGVWHSALRRPRTPLSAGYSKIWRVSLGKSILRTQISIVLLGLRVAIKSRSDSSEVNRPYVFPIFGVWVAFFMVGDRCESRCPEGKCGHTQAQVKRSRYQSVPVGRGPCKTLCEVSAYWANLRPQYILYKIRLWPIAAIPITWALRKLPIYDWTIALLYTGMRSHFWHTMSGRLLRYVRMTDSYCTHLQRII